MNNSKILAALVGGAALLAGATASAHISIVNPGIANANTEVVFSVGHGCEDGAVHRDTSRVSVEIPDTAIVADSVRPLRSDFGPVSVTKGTGITTVTWTKNAAEALDGDIGYYKLVIRLKPVNQAFTRHYLKTKQWCRNQGEVTETGPVGWDTLPEGDAGGTAPTLLVLPARQPGWNKYTVPADINDLATWFKDAQIVWKGNAAYSSNPNTVAQIAAEAGATALTALKANDEIWVRY